MRSVLGFCVRGARRLSGFAASVILLAVASLVLMPATIGAAGLQTWSSIVLAQALAQVLATVVGCGYGVNGPAVVATLSAQEGVNYFRVAQRTKFLVALPCFALMIGAMFTIPNPDPIAGMLGGAPLIMNAFSAIFFYIGRAAPLWLLWAETAPRVALMFAGAATLALGGPLLVGLALPVLGTALGIAISVFTIRRSTGRPTPRVGRLTVQSLRTELRVQFGPAAASMLRGGRDALPVLVLTAVAGHLVGAFGVFDRVQRQALGALAPLTSALQGWVPRRMAVDNNARAAVAAMFATFAGAAGFLVCFILLGPPLIRWLSAGTISPTFAENVLCGAAIATGILVQVIAYVCLVPLGSIRGVILGNVAGIVAISIAIPIASTLEQTVSYALAAVVIGNIAQIVVQLFVMRRRVPQARHSARRDD